VSQTPEGRKRISLAKMGDKNPMWKGDDVSYISLHQWVREQIAKPETCQECHKAEPLDVANISQEYKRDLEDWEWLCRSCHMKKDGRMSNRDENGRFIKCGDDAD